MHFRLFAGHSGAPGDCKGTKSDDKRTVADGRALTNGGAAGSVSGRNLRHPAPLSDRAAPG